MMSGIPNVIVIGASKCGTTSLHEYFLNHPEVFVSSKKELHYHSAHELTKYTKGPGDKYIIKQICQTKEAYLTHYKDASTFIARVDVSPSYLFFPSSIEYIKQTCGDNVKIICLVKHPVDKMVSQYTHLLSEGREKNTFEEALKIEQQRKADGYADMWLYLESAYMSDKIKLFKESFNNVLVINSADLQNNPKDTLGCIFKFISVDSSKLTKYNNIVKNFSGIPKSLVVSKIFLQPNSFTHLLRKIIPQKLGKEVRDWINSRNKGVRYSISSSLEKELETTLRGEIKSLNKLIDSNTKIGLKYKD